MKKVIINKGIDEEKIKIVTNWADSSINYEKKVHNSFYEKHNLNGKFNVLYTGNISKVHAIDTILNVAKLLKDSREIQFTFVGDGNRRAYIENLKKKEKLRNIQLKDYMFGEEYNNLLNCADVFITTLQEGIEGLGVPSKTYTYMSVSKPLIAIMNKNSEIGSMVNENNLGKQFSFNEEEEIVKFIKNIKDDTELYDSISGNVREKFRSEYERKRVTKKFYNIVISNNNR